jgi:hypothetical protein
MTIVIAILLLRYVGFALSSVLGFSSVAWYISGQRKDWKTIVKALVVRACHYVPDHFDLRVPVAGAPARR